MSFTDIERIQEDPSETQDIELVERKGIGHPDSISDGIAEAVSRRLCREYRKRFGHVLHHNTDEVQLVAGSSKPEFSGGDIQQPIYLLLAGRATKEHEGEKIPVDELAIDAAKNYIQENFEYLKPGHIDFESRIGETSTDLQSIFSDTGVPLANDTSFGVGHAPLSPTEKVVKNLENEIYRIEGTGRDIKVMGLRRGSELKLTVATATVSSRISDLEEYRRIVSEVKEKAKGYAASETDLDVSVDVNTADDYENNSVYLTVTGTSAEMGDDGSVGRGNRVNGIITPNRPMSLEAASGKNPVTHVGKIYNLLSGQISKDIHSETGQFAQVKLLSQIGKPIDQPQTVHVETTSEDEKAIKEAVRSNLDDLEALRDNVINGEMNTF